MIQNVIFGTIYLKILFRAYNFLIFAQMYQWTSSEFLFNFRFSSRNLKANKLRKKIANFIIQFRSKNITHFMNLNSLDIENNMLLLHSQKPSWIYQKFSSKHISVWCQKKHLHPTVSWRPKLHSWSNLKANVRLFVRKDVVRFYQMQGCVWGRLIDFIKAALFLGLLTCFTFFHFNWNFCKSNYFSAFWYFHL